MLMPITAIRRGTVLTAAVAWTLICAVRCPADEPSTSFSLRTTQYIHWSGYGYGSFTASGAIQDEGIVVTEYRTDGVFLLMTGEFGELEVRLYNGMEWYGVIIADFEITDGAGAWAGLSGGGAVYGTINYEGASSYYQVLNFSGELDANSPPPPTPLPELAINDVSIVEGSRGRRYARFTVALSSASEETVSVEYTTFDGTATVSNRDYSATHGVLYFGPGDTSATISVKVRGDRRREPDETFYVDLGNPDGAMLADDEGIGTILNDD